MEWRNREAMVAADIADRYRPERPDDLTRHRIAGHFNCRVAQDSFIPTHAGGEQGAAVRLQFQHAAEFNLQMPRNRLDGVREE